MVVPLVTLVVLAAVGVGVFPRFANYAQAWSSVVAIPFSYLIGLVLVAAVNIVVSAWPLQAALPGLRFRPAFVVGQTSFAVSNTVPAGGAIGIGVEYDMLESYGFGAGPAASAAVISSVFNVFATLAMPVVGILALLAEGEPGWNFVLIAVIGVASVGSALGVFAVILRSVAGARRIGELADRLGNRLPRRLRRGRTIDVAGRILDFRSGVVDVMRRRPVAVLGSALLPQFTSWGVLYVALRGLEHVTRGDLSLSWPESLAAFSFAAVVSFIPITAGGLGTVDAALTGLIAAFGATASQALAADLIWRLATFVPQVAVGALMFLLWETTAGRRRHAGRRGTTTGS